MNADFVTDAIWDRILFKSKVQYTHTHTKKKGIGKTPLFDWEKVSGAKGVKPCATVAHMKWKRRHCPEVLVYKFNKPIGEGMRISS